MMLLQSASLQVGDALSATLPGKEPLLCFVARKRKDGSAGIKFDVKDLRDQFGNCEVCSPPTAIEALEG